MLAAVGDTPDVGEPNGVIVDPGPEGVLPRSDAECASRLGVFLQLVSPNPVGHVIDRDRTVNRET